MLLLQAALPEPLDLYGELIREFHSTYGQPCWYLVYQADNRMRHEQMERLRTRYVIDHKSAPLNWGEVYLLAVRDREFWNAEVRDKALLYLTRVKSRTESMYDGTSQAFISPSLGGIDPP